MSNPFETKGIFVWEMEAIEGGDSAKIAKKLVEGQFECAYLHVTDVHLIKSRIKPGLVTALKKAGLSVIGSSAIYGHLSDQEGTIAGQGCVDLGLDGFIFDAEGEFESQPHPNSNAVKVMINFRAVAGELPVGWCYFPLLHAPGNPNRLYHNTDVVRAALETVPTFHGADYGMPMVYWNPGILPEDAINYLTNSFNMWREFTAKPIIPIGRAYQGDEGRATPEAVRAFATHAQQLGCPGIGWWSMLHAINEDHLPGVWPALTATPKFTTTPAVVEEPAAVTKVSDPNEVLKALVAWAKTQPSAYSGPELA